jgi:hypothetical protein
VSDWAAPDDVLSAAQGWSDGQVNCRVYGHAWRPLTVTHRPGFYTIFQRCGRCRNERQQEVNERGYPVTQWHMTYVEGYLLRGLGRVGQDGRAALRLRSLQGLFINEVQDD